jgi:hypothetical protein
VKALQSSHKPGSQTVICIELLSQMLLSVTVYVPGVAQLNLSKSELIFTSSYYKQGGKTMDSLGLIDLIFLRFL